MQWQRDQVLALAPDQKSVKAAQPLTTPNKWPALGRSQIALWGECQGSGKTPYKTAIDLREPAFSCSCPSRKFPCKHALALFLIATQPTVGQSADSFVETEDVPDWVQGWLDGRSKRAKARSARNGSVKTQNNDPSTALPTSQNGDPNSAKADPKAAERRAAARADKVAAGVAELLVWLNDLVRSGYVEAQSRPDRYWQQMAARLIDAQAPGLASQVQMLGMIAHSGEGWADRLTATIGRLFLLLEAYPRIEQLPKRLQQDVRTQIGWYQSKEEVLAGTPVHGQWRVLSHIIEPEEKLLSQRIWLQETTQKSYALILNFAHPTNRQTLDTHWRVGTTVSATVHYYESAVPLRAIANDVAAVTPFNSLGQGEAIADALQRFQQALALSPWLECYPLLLADVVVGLDDPQSKTTSNVGHFYLYDQESHLLPISAKAKTQWKLLSITGGQPTQLFGEWLTDGILPLGLWHEGRYWAL